jgi:hypothetical protein
VLVILSGWLLRSGLDFGRRDKSPTIKLMKAKLPHGTLDKLWSDPRNWRAHSFYYCKNDPRIFVPKRLKLFGWTMNFAHASAWGTLFMGIAFAIGPIIYLKDSGNSVWIFLWIAIMALLSWGVGSLMSSPNRYEKKPISIRGPVETRDGKLTLMIPLAAGGSELATYSKGIAEIEGEYLRVTIPDWLASKMKIQDGSLIDVDNQNGEFTFSPVGLSN